MTLQPTGAAPITIRGGGPAAPTVTGSHLELARWLSGRGAGGVRSDGPLPDLPPY
jgi:hypothetical protein